MNYALHWKLIVQEENFKTMYMDIFHTIQKRIEPYQRSRNIHRKGRPLKVGDLVFKAQYRTEPGKNKKFLPKREGPFKIIKVLSEVTYLIRVNNKDISVHRNHLIEYIPKENCFQEMLNDFSQPQLTSSEQETANDFSQSQPISVEQESQPTTTSLAKETRSSKVANHPVKEPNHPVKEPNSNSETAITRAKDSNSEREQISTRDKDSNSAQEKNTRAKDSDSVQENTDRAKDSNSDRDISTISDTEHSFDERAYPNSQQIVNERNSSETGGTVAKDRECTCINRSREKDTEGRGRARMPKTRCPICRGIRKLLRSNRIKPTIFESGDQKRSNNTNNDGNSRSRYEQNHPRGESQADRSQRSTRPSRNVENSYNNFEQNSEIEDNRGDFDKRYFENSMEKYDGRSKEHSGGGSSSTAPYSSNPFTNPFSNTRSIWDRKQSVFGTNAECNEEFGEREYDTTQKPHSEYIQGKANGDLGNRRVRIINESSDSRASETSYDSLYARAGSVYPYAGTYSAKEQVPMLSNRKFQNRLPDKYHSYTYYQPRIKESDEDLESFSGESQIYREKLRNRPRIEYGQNKSQKRYY